MPLLKQGEIIEDAFCFVEDGDEMPVDCAAVVTLSRWQADKDILAQRNAPLGIKLATDEDPRSLGDDIHRFAIVAMEFPKFSDGRSYSHARLVRERLGYKGELRAVGHVLQDQFRLMHRCGFDAVDAKDDVQAAAWAEMVAELSHAYQPATDTQEAVYEIRHRRERSAA